LVDVWFVCDVLMQGAVSMLLAQQELQIVLRDRNWRLREIEDVSSFELGAPLVLLLCRERRQCFKRNREDGHNRVQLPLNLRRNQKLSSITRLMASTVSPTGSAI